MHRMMRHTQPDDFVVGTGESHSVRELCEQAFGRLQLDYHDFVKTDPRYFRPTEVDVLLADPRKARQVLGWEPKVRFKELVQLMVDADLDLAEREYYAQTKGRRGAPPSAPGTGGGCE